MSTRRATEARPATIMRRANALNAVASAGEATVFCWSTDEDETGRGHGGLYA